MKRREKKPKVYAVADEVPRDIDYLTAGKRYLVRWEDKENFSIIDDENNKDDARVCRWVACSHLSGGSWRREVA